MIATLKLVQRSPTDPSSTRTTGRSSIYGTFYDDANFTLMVRISLILQSTNDYNRTIYTYFIAFILAQSRELKYGQF